LVFKYDWTQSAVPHIAAVIWAIRLLRLFITNLEHGGPPGPGVGLLQDFGYHEAFSPWWAYEFVYSRLLVRIVVFFTGRLALLSIGYARLFRFTARNLVL